MASRSVGPPDFDEALDLDTAFFFGADFREADFFLGDDFFAEAVFFAGADFFAGAAFFEGDLAAAFFTPFITAGREATACAGTSAAPSIAAISSARCRSSFESSAWRAFSSGRRLNSFCASFWYSALTSASDSASNLGFLERLFLAILYNPFL